MILLVASLWVVVAPIQAQQAEPTATDTHEVQAGETLSTIAESYGVALDALMAENGITDPDTVVIGAVLRLPAAAQRQPTPQPLPTHVVAAGETLSEIAQAYDITLTQLMLANGLRDANAVVEGQRLRIPDTTAPTADTPTPSATTTAPPTTQPTATPIPTTTRAAAPTVNPDTALDPESVTARIASLNRTYTIAQGDTFARIALRTGVDQEALRRLNRLTPEETTNLLAGQELLLPATGDDLRVQRAGREHVVQPGDTLGSIANQYDLSLAELLNANFLADPDSLTVGQRLTIPQPTKNETIAAQRENQVGPQRGGFYYYTVHPGDTLSTLAQAFNSSKLALLEYNGLPDEETVYAGLELRIPYGPPKLPDRRPPTPASGTSFLVSLSRQQCWLFHGNRVAKEWTCSTGYGEWITRTGTFAVQSKIEVAESSAYRLDMPYWLGIYNVGQYENGIHGLPVDWDTGEKIWEGLIGEPATFGCAMLDDPDAAELFATAYIGMPVHVIN
jgi:LysM repeat protein